MSEKEETQEAPKKTRKKIDVKGQGKKLAGEFKQFAFKGNIIDLAIAVIIGAAFGKIVSSFVADVIMPCLGALIGDVNFSDLKIVLKPGTAEVAETALRYGAFIQTIFEFFIIALSIFIIFRVVLRLRKLTERKKEVVPPPAPKMSKTDELLTDIKKLLETNKKGE